MSPTALRARQIEALSLPAAQEDALLGLSHRCAAGLICTTSAGAVRTLMGYRQRGDLETIRTALAEIESKGLVTSVARPSSKYSRTYTLLPERWA